MNKENRVAVILAGGKASRMQGQDKAMLPLWGKPLIEHTLDRLQGHVNQIVISINQNPERLSELRLVCIEDAKSAESSPLLGILSALDYFASQSRQIQSMLCLPVDVPVYPECVIDDLFVCAESTASGLAYVEVANQVQPLFSIWPLSIRDELRESVHRGELGVMRNLARLDAGVLRVESPDPLDFANINTPAELEALRQEKLSC